MSAKGSLPRNDDTGATSDEVELAEVLESYLAHLEAGQPADPEGLIANHPELARPLRACLRVMHLAQGLDESRELPLGPLAVDREAFEPVPPTGSSALTAVWPGEDQATRVLLPEPPEDDSPILRTHSADRLATLGVDAGRYQVLGEIARGGMGMVLKARDADLGRDLALKVLLDRHRGDQDVVRRFVEEAQIGGQLQHPGIVPVHELGALADQRPFFAMKLVKGRTLSSLLNERTSPAQDLPRFLTIFEAICQTVAYAHARRVIHRDMKPANVMVGNFGEVQVMDWGLAKVLAEGGVADEAKAMQIAETAILTVRSGSAGSGSESQAGSVLGTPAYMAPEQARGDVEQIDERADVFGLGAILCEILTGRPPYMGSTREEIRDKAARAELADALGRLVACGADAELVILARDCVSPERKQRPRNAGDVSRRLTAHLAGVQDRLRAAELARVEAQTRAEESQARASIERSRRRRTVALAASVLVMAASVAAGSFYFAQQQQERAVKFNRALGEAEGLYAEALRVGDDLSRWLAAREAAHVVEGLLVGAAADGSTPIRLTALVRNVDLAAVAAEADQKLMARLDDIRSRQYRDGDGSDADAGYAEAFREAGFDADALDPNDVGAKIRARPTAVTIALATALDEWADVRSTRHDRAGARRLAEIARIADADEWRNRFRELCLRSLTDKDAVTTLRDLAQSARVDELRPVSLHLLGSKLLTIGDLTGGEKLLRIAQRRYPGDVWLNHTLALFLTHQGRQNEATWYYMAARSLRPELSHGLAHALWDQGRTDEAIAVFRDSLSRARPKDNGNYLCLANMLKDQGRTKELNTLIEAAIARTRAAIELEPGRWQGHGDYAQVLRIQGKLAEATAECREALRLNPRLGSYYHDFVQILTALGRFEEAVAVRRQGVRLEPASADTHYWLSTALRENGQYDESLAEINRGRELALMNPIGREASDERARGLAETVELYRNLPSFLSGKAKSVNAAQSTALALILYEKKLQGSSARFWEDAFKAQPSLADDMNIPNRYNAASVAALAGCGQGRDNPPLDDAAKTYWRRQALDWLKADLAAWSGMITGGQSEIPDRAPQMLQHWKADTDLAGIRDTAALVKLSADEQKACRALWAEVDTLLAKAQGTKPE